jgi:glycerol-1-phosphate dehydrogenase [NAD(P)+]
MNTIPTVYIGADAVSQLVGYCAAHRLEKFVLVADENTYAALGARVEQALTAAHADVRAVVLRGPEVIADEHYMVQVMVHVDPEPRTYIAVGGGTLTDIARFVSHRAHSPFISVPSAPSVDGFTSPGAPLVVEGLKVTYSCQSPIAIFADLATLAAAPQALIAAGFGDILGKYLSLADWELGHGLWDERWDAAIADRVRLTTQSCVDAAGEIGAHSERGVQTLMAGLVESGLGMLAFGNSAPASGGEHHLSHHWEMMLLRKHRPAIFHGLKVGIASLLTARRYHALAALTRDQAAARLRWSDQFSRAAQIRAAYGSMADEIIREQAAFLDWTPATYGSLCERILDRWDVVQAIAHAVPAPAQLAAWLEQVGGPVVAGAVGLSDAEVGDALESGHYLRNRFTVNKLWFTLNLPPRAVTLP